MTNEATKPIKPGSEQDDPEYPYLLFVQDRGWKYVSDKLPICGRSLFDTTRF